MLNRYWEGRNIMPNLDRKLDEAKELGSLEADVAMLKDQMKTLQFRLWGLLSGIIVAVAGAGATWYFS